jgi:hypothetical protein
MEKYVSHRPLNFDSFFNLAHSIFKISNKNDCNKRTEVVIESIFVKITITIMNV